MELGQSGKIEQNLPFLYLILANCPLFSLNSYSNSELVHIVTPSTFEGHVKAIQITQKHNYYFVSILRCFDDHQNIKE